MYIHVYIYIYTHIHVYIYIYIERERDRVLLDVRIPHAPLHGLQDLVRELPDIIAGEVIVESPYT